MKIPCRSLLYSALSLVFGVSALFSYAANDYLVINISNGFDQDYPVDYYDTLPLDATNDTYKTDYILLRKIPAGTFMMGSPTNEVGRSSNEVLHQVTLTGDYYIGVFEITEHQWHKVAGQTPISKKAKTYVSRVDRIEYLFLTQLNKGADLGEMNATLPTEPQWEMACRAGTQTSYSFGSDANQLNDYAWYGELTGVFAPYDVGLKMPNPFGLYDMHGNVAEFCFDGYVPDLGTNSVEDPPPVGSSGLYVVKGGSFKEVAANCRSAYRSGVGAAGSQNIGFRISVNIPPQYDLTVINGSGSGSYTNSHVQEIIAYLPTAWHEFDQWTGDLNNVLDAFAPTTIVTIAEDDLTITATYKPLEYDITVSNGVASVSTATNGQVVVITANDPPNATNVFYRWEGDVATVANISAMTTTVTVAGDDLNLIATYRDAPYYLTVNGGTGSGYCFAGQLVAITAPPPAADFTFWWSGDNSTVADPEAPSTTLIMPGRNAEITATYPDIKYNLTVVNGNGSGSYVNGERVNVSVGTVPSSMHEFDQWFGDTSGLDSFIAPSTVYTINGKDAVVEPHYRPLAAVQGVYMVVNLVYSGSGYQITYMDQPPAGGWDSTYKQGKMVFRRIMPGTYQMGDGTVSGIDEHTVNLTESFYIGIFEVTQGQWYNVKADYPSHYTGTGKSYHPVEQISYEDIRGIKGRDWPDDADVDDLSFVGIMRADGGSDGFDLPTEAQWEYACRAGTGGDYYDSTLTDIAVYSINSGGSTWEAGLKDPNNWGLYDTLGNVMEWCLDRFISTNLGTAEQTDPVGSSSYTTKRVIRGGAYGDAASPYLKAGYRAGPNSYDTAVQIGFRMAKAAGVPRTLTVADGKINTSGTFYYRAKIAISPLDKLGQTFDYWKVEPEGTFAGGLFNARERDTVITMPNKSIIVTAQYK